mgnify:CR=1 FL=1
MKGGSMYIAQKNTKYYLIDLLNNSQKTFKDKDELIFFLKRGYSIIFQEGREDQYLEDINMNGNDLSIYSDSSGENRLLRRYMFLDSDNRILDIRKWKKEIEEFNYRNYRKQNPKNKKFAYEIKQEKSYMFRKDPVPNIGNLKGYKRYYRHMRTTQERRYASAPEYKPYVRAKRNTSNLPDVYNDIYRHYDSSWKNKKIKNQWMKNCK